MSGGVRAVMRAGWGVADQVLSSVVNFSLGVAVARTGTPTDFGIYSLIFSAYLISINVARPLGVEPLIITFVERSATVWRDQLRAASGLVVVAGAMLSLVALLIGLGFVYLLGQMAGLAFVVLGIGLVGLVLQDTWRLAFFAERRGADAFVNDLVWATVMGAAIVALTVTGQASVVTLVAAWAIGGNVAALAGIARVGVTPAPRRAGWWWATQRALARPLLVEHIVTNVAGEAIPYLVGIIAGISAVAAMRAAQLLLGPFNILLQALGLIALPEAVRIAARSRTRLIEAAVAFSGFLASAVIIVGLVMANLPDQVGTAILGQTWALAQSVLIPYTFLIAGAMAAAGPTIGLRAIGQAFESMVVGATRSGLSLIGAVVGAAGQGATGATLGMAVGQWAGAAATWWRFLARVRTRNPALDEDATTAF